MPTEILTILTVVGRNMQRGQRLLKRSFDLYSLQLVYPALHGRGYRAFQFLSLAVVSSALLFTRITRKPNSYNQALCPLTPQLDQPCLHTSLVDYGSCRPALELPNEALALALMH